jgi:hypothetical protein
MTPVITQCKSCSSSRLLELDAEMCLHFPVLGGLDKPPIFASAKLFVCRDCGSVQYNLSESDLARVRESAPKADGAHE